MATPTPVRWEDLDPQTRRELDEDYLADLEHEQVEGLTEEGVRVYLDYRHERPGAQITTYEEGQLRRLLRGTVDPSRIPDPVEEEEHLGRIENFGARRLHLTNFGTYSLIVFLHVYAGLLGILLYLLLRG